MFNIISKYFSFFNNKHLQADSRIQQWIFLHVIPVRFIVPWYDVGFFRITIMAKSLFFQLTEVLKICYHIHSYRS